MGKKFVPFKKKSTSTPAKSAPQKPGPGKPSITPGQKSGPGYMGF